MHDDVWSDYNAWNETLTDRLFSVEAGGMPVYIDVDEAFVAALGNEVSERLGRAAANLPDAVRGTLGLRVGESPLQEHLRRFQRWRRAFSLANEARRKGAQADLPAPPVIALLTSLVMAAARMGASDGVAATAYYPRLGETLGLEPNQLARLKTRFSQTELFWRGLNEFLEAHEGHLGLPTAYALSWRYAGIPQSQAVIREADRRRLPDFFAQFGLVPGSEMVPADLERLLDLWIGSQPSPVTKNLQSLWRGVKARERVAGVAAVELSLWDGSRRSGEPSDAAPSGLELTALLRRGFGARSLELSFAARFAGAPEVSELEILSADGAPRIGATGAAGGRVRPVPGSRFDPASMVGAVVEVRVPGTDQTAARRPRRVVPLRTDELLGAMVEIERVQLAEDTTLVVKDDGRLLDKVLDVVRAYGRHGKVSRGSGEGDEALDGLPEGWALVEDVQLYAIPRNVKLLDLHVLVPLMTAQLTFSGGLKMPGRIRKWSSLHPPEIRAAVDQADSIRVTLADLRGEDSVLLEEWSDDASAMSIPLQGLELEDGDYEIALHVNGEKEPISQTTLRLRSSDTPDAVTWETCARLNYELDRGAFSALSAVAVDGDTASDLVVDGLLTHGRAAHEIKPVPVRNGASWATSKRRSGVQRPTVVLGVADDKSCVVTGAHYIQLPDWHGGRSRGGQILGTCKHCGLQKTHPARPQWKGIEKGADAVKPLKFVEQFVSEGAAVDPDACLDALVHVGGGEVSVLERIVSQAQPGALYFDQFVRGVEALGHVDVRRDLGTLQPVEWEANPAFLAETCSPGVYVLAGVWSPSARELLRRHVLASGGVLERGGRRDPVSCWFVRGLDSAALNESVERAGVHATVVEDAARAMLAALPPLSAVEAALPRVPVPQHAKATIFDIQTAAWVVTPGVAAPGAYRVEQSFKTLSIWLDDTGAVERTCRIGSVQLVKHLAALRRGQPLVGYHPERSMLLVPMGAELPALYGRVASLCSGEPPLVSPATRTVAYPHVPRDVADGISTLLAS